MAQVKAEDVRRAREFAHDYTQALLAADGKGEIHILATMLAAYAAAETGRLTREVAEANNAADVNSGLIDKWMDKANEFEAECDRLRKALEYLLKVYKANYSEGEKTPAIRLAEAALQGDSAGGEQ